jgi:hypothetical protein
VWVGSDGVTEDEFAALGREGLKITRFAYPLGTSTVEELDEALGMVELHHPGEAIWVQHRPGTLR